MAEVPNTRASLLIRLRDARDDDAWRQFVRLYAPVVYGYARRRGLQDADAADVAQEVLRAVAGASQRWEFDAGRGQFRSWLFTVAHHKVHDFLVGRRPGQAGSGDSRILDLLDQQHAQEDSQIWDQEYESRLFAWAAEQAQQEFEASTWHAFRLTAVEGKSGKEAAAELGMSVAAVYLAKSRVVARLRELIGEHEKD